MIDLSNRLEMLEKMPPQLLSAVGVIMIAVIMIVLIPVAMITVKSKINLKDQSQ
jgi:hypothetical protein